MTLDDAIIWKKIVDFPNYSISSDGQIRNDKTKKMRTLQLDRNGYVVCRLYDNGIQKECKVHRLVSQAFIPNIDNKPYINHKNGIKTDNRVDNLEWCTSKENNYHAWNVLDSLERRKKMAEHSHNRVWTLISREKISKINKNRKHTESAKRNMSEAHKGKKGNNQKKIMCIETGIIYSSITKASEDMGILRTSICNVLSGLSENARGYHFRKVVE